MRKDWLICEPGRDKAPFAPIRRNLLFVPGMSGAYLGSSERQPLYIRQPIAFKARDDEHALQIRDELAAWLITDEPAPLVFDDEPGRIFYAVVQNTLEDFRKMASIRKGTIEFIVLDGYAYGCELIATFPSDVVSLTNRGTADADPIFELEVKRPVTYALIQNQNEEYMMIGKPYDITEQKPFVREEKIYDKIGDTTTGWATASTVDGGVVSGLFYTTGQSWRAQTYGPVVAAWHGPSLVQSLPELLGDFKVEVYMTVKPKTLKSFGRAELYLLNQGGAKIAKLAMKNIGSEGGSNIAEVTLRNETTGNRRTLIHTPGAQQRLWNNFYGVMRLEREKGVFRASVAMIDTDTGQHHTRWHSEPFEDIQGLYDDLLAGVQIHIGQYGAVQFIEDIAIHRIKVYKINQPGENQIPYIADTGDIITFDHQDKQILINGEARKDLKNFGASYFSLKPGANQLVVLPEESFDVTCKYRERYK